MSDRERLERERVFHDRLAEDLRPELMPPEALEPLDRAIIARAGIGSGTRVLELGCGAGGLTLTLLEMGANVTALDLSPGMVDVARRRIMLYAGGRTADLLVAPVERSGLPSGSFDVIVGRFILHHLQPEVAAPEIARLLAPSGIAVFAENSGRNPVLNAARDHLAGRFGIPRFGTPDERPLSAEDVASFRPYFRVVELSYPVFEFMALFDRQVLRFRSRRVTRACRALDRAAGRVNMLQRQSFRVVVALRA